MPLRLYFQVRAAKSINLATVGFEVEKIIREARETSPEVELFRGFFIK